MDAFTSASPLYRRAAANCNRPLQLAAFEVAELPKPWSARRKLTVMFISGFLGWMVVFLMVAAVAQQRGY